MCIRDRSDTGAELCQKAPKKLNCCGGIFVVPHGKLRTAITNGAEWRTGKNSEACQEAMYEAYLFDMERVKK